jgi:hypothetical protein
MAFTQNLVICTIRIQRAWRLSLRERTTRKLVHAMIQTGCCNSVLGNLQRWEFRFVQR